MIVVKNRSWKIIIRSEFIVLINDDLYQEFSLINIYKSQQNYKIRVNKKNYISSKIFRKIKKIQEKIPSIYKG